VVREREIKGELTVAAARGPGAYSPLKGWCWLAKRGLREASKVALDQIRIEVWSKQSRSIVGAFATEEAALAAVFAAAKTHGRA